MKRPLSESHPLRRMFAGITEQTFMAELGLADTKLIDYLAGLLARFIHRDAIYAIRSADGHRLHEVAAMLMEAERSENRGNVRREIYRHIGDFALFWIGVYPESLMSRSARMRADALMDYSEQGKRSYYIASTYADTPSYAAEAPVLRRLADEFDLCAAGLRKVRNCWESALPGA